MLKSDNYINFESKIQEIENKLEEKYHHKVKEYDY